MKQDLNRELSKRVIYTILTVSVLSSGISLYSFFTQEKLMFVDYNKLINGYKGMIAVKAGLQNRDERKETVDALTTEVKRLMTDYEKQSDKMTMRERQLSQELIKTKQQQLYEYQQFMKTQTWLQDDEMTRDVIDQVNVYVKIYGERHHYKIILATTDYTNLTYVDKSLDITGEVLAALNKAYIDNKTVASSN